MPYRALLLQAALALLLLAGCRDGHVSVRPPASTAPALVLRGPFVHEAQIMGSRFRVTLYATDADSAGKAAQEAFLAAQKVNDLLSDYQNDSETLRLAALPHGVAHPVSPEFAEVLTVSLRFAAETDGAFDPTVGPATRLWRRARLGKPMDWKALEEARPALGWRKLGWDAQARAVTFSLPGMRLDFGGIGKGWAADSALRLLRSKGLSIASVAASGDLAIGDPPPGRTGWKVGIESIDSTGGAVTTEVELSNCGISTSGDTSQFLELEGKRFSHIVDPRTGMALSERRGVSVVAPSAIESDAFSTALSVMGPELGKFWAEQRGVAAFFVSVSGDGRQTRQCTGGWPAFRARKSAAAQTSRLATSPAKP